MLDSFTNPKPEEIVINYAEVEKAAAGGSSTVLSKDIILLK